MNALLVGFLFLVSTSVATAQSESIFGLLSPPVGPLLCHSLRATPADSARFIVRFVDGTDLVAGRQTIVAYDSTGTPLYMAIRANDSVAPTTKIHAISVRFVPERRGLWVVVEEGPDGRILRRGKTGELTHVPPQGPDLLTEGEISHARDLALWFWNHRCDK